MKNLGATSGQSVCFIIAQVVEKFSFGRGMRISGVNPIDIGPDDEFFGVDNIRNDSAGKIGAVAAKRGDAAVGSRADEAGNDGDQACFEERKKNGTAALPGLLQMRLGVAECIAGEDEIGGRHRDSGDAGFFESGGEETYAEPFTEGGEAIGEFAGRRDMAIQLHFMEKIATEKLKAAANTLVLFIREQKILKHVEVEMNDAFGFIARMRQFSIG